MNLPRTLFLLVVAVLSLAASAGSRAAVLIECSFASTGDTLDRGFYIDNYPGTSLRTVTLAHMAGTDDERTITLTARLSTFDGQLLGMATVTRRLVAEPTQSIFDFGNLPVTPGSRITFQQTQVSGPGNVTFDIGIGPCPNLVETEGTTPPVSTVLRNSVGIQVTGDPVSNASALLLSCPFSPTLSEDRIDRGIYVTDFPGVSIQTVALRHSTDTPGLKTINLIARLGTFDGPILGVAAITRDIGATLTPSVFVFDDIPVPAGSTVTFQQVMTDGSGQVFFDTGFTPCDTVFETLSANPGSQIRRNSAGISISGRVASDDLIPVVEYYHQGFGHVFMTADPDEIAALDAGAFGGVFVRTGRQLLARDGPVSGTVPVCRFFTTAFAPKSSHFYTADAAECEFVKNNQIGRARV